MLPNQGKREKTSENSCQLRISKFAERYTSLRNLFVHFRASRTCPKPCKCIKKTTTSNKIIRKSRKRNRTKDRKIKNKRGGDPRDPTQWKSKAHKWKQMKKREGGAVSFSMFGAPLDFPLFSIVFFRFSLCGVLGVPPSLVLDISTFCLVYVSWFPYHFVWFCWFPNRCAWFGRRAGGTKDPKTSSEDLCAFPRILKCITWQAFSDDFVHIFLIWSI